MRLSLIAAVSDNGIIGRGQELPWRLSADLRRFKALTMGHYVIMGRKTFASIGRPLPGRNLIVVSRQPNFLVVDAIVMEGLAAAIDLAKQAGDGEAFVIGGGEIYRQSIGLVDRLYLTRVHANIDGDVRFPPIDWSQWQLTDESRHDADEKNEYDSSFQIFDRVASSH